jgi:glycosyltransferase involved in cell wall biosynthesis
MSFIVSAAANKIEGDATAAMDPVPKIAPVTQSEPRPFWSVMIPTYNCGEYLAQTLQSVLAQDLDPDLMQIEVVDDCSNQDDPEAVVRVIGRGRVKFYRKPKNAGPIANFNTCIERSRGHYVHILHGDDTISAGYYDCVGDLIKRFPDAGFYATRCFGIDAESVLIWASARVEDLEAPSKDARLFYYESPVQCAGVTVRRASYEKLGGFRTDLVHAADLEMWARVISVDRGVVSREVKANYRIFPQNDTGRLAKTGENIRDICRLHGLFASRYPDFSMAVARQKAANRALSQYKKFLALGDLTAARINRNLWSELTPFRKRTMIRIRESTFYRRMVHT